MTDVEQLLKQTYAERLDGLDVTAGEIGAARREGTRMRVRRRMTVGVAAVAAVAVAATGSLLGTGRISIGPSDSHGHWRELPAPPLSPRAHAQSVWTGDEVIVLGGEPDPCPPNASCVSPDEVLRDGAAYNPTSNTWRAVPPAPVPVGPGDRLVVADGVVVLRHWQQHGSRWFTYEPDHRRWSPITHVPKGVGDLPSAYGSKVYVPDGRRIAVYDVTTFRWTTLPPDDLEPRLAQRRVIATGVGVVVAGYDSAEQHQDSTPSVALADVFDGTSWRRLPPTGQLGNGWVWNGSLLVDPDPTVEDGGETNPFPHEYPVGGLLDPTTGEWSTLPASVIADPGEGWGVDAAGPRWFATFGQVYDSRTGAVVPLPRPDGAPLSGVTASWAGNHLLAFGGADYGSDGAEPTNRAWLYTPPPS